MIRTLSQAAAQHQAQQQASERQAEQQRDLQRQARQQFLQSRDVQRADPRAALPRQPGRVNEAPPVPRSSLRSEARRPTDEDHALFSALLEGDDVMAQRLALDQGSDQQQGFTQLEETPSSAAPPAMALWQEIEPALISALAEQPPGEMQLTLMLPKLGNVDAHMTALAAGGWDIALHLQPGAWQALLPHQERCRFSLRQKMACRVRLRFERRMQGDEREQQG